MRMSRQRPLEKIIISEYVTVGELVRLTGMRYSTLKYYTEEGMLPFEPVSYTHLDVYKRQARFLRRAGT